VGGIKPLRPTAGGNDGAGGSKEPLDNIGADGNEELLDSTSYGEELDCLDSLDMLRGDTAFEYCFETLLGDGVILLATLSYCCDLI